MNDEESKAGNVIAAIPTSIAPWLSVRNSTKAIEFYKAAFGATEVYRLDVPQGGPVVRLSVNGAEFWVSEEFTGNENDPELVGGESVRMILTVQNPDEFFENSIKAGALEVFAVGEDHGWRLGRLVDPFGLHWEIGRPLSS
jgi:PhnB protein